MRIALPQTAFHDRQTVRFQSAMGLSVTARCPIECAHCIIKGGRFRTEEMDGGAAAALLDACVEYDGTKIDAVVITGGEPFFAPTLLRYVLARASKLGLVSAVVTNAFWATSPRAALATLQAQGEVGLLTFSTDRFHQRHVSLEKVENAIFAARQLSIPFNVAVCGDDEAELRAAEEQLREIVGPERIRGVLTLPAGRRATMPGPQPDPEPEGAAARCTGADYPLVFPDGRVIACMGIVESLPARHPLLLGNTNERPLGELLHGGETNVFIHAIRAIGTAETARSLLGERAAEVSARYRSFGGCWLCYAMARDSVLLDCVLDGLGHDEFRERVAYARLFFLDEVEMASRLPCRIPGAMEDGHG